MVIQDNGRGISVKQPDEQRGLGLSNMMQHARIHGGDIALSQSPLGGLKAVLKVPV